jgi:hypothetical protein
MRHDITTLEYRCRVCDKSWPSGRSAMSHYSRSSCRGPSGDGPQSVAASCPESTRPVRRSPSPSLGDAAAVAEPVDESMARPTERIDSAEKYYCTLCAAGGWEKKVGLSQHMRHRHRSEYNTAIEVGQMKRRWTRDEMVVLAEIEAGLPLRKGGNINSALAEKLPSRTFDAIKSRRKSAEYKSILEEIRQRRGTTATPPIELEETDDSDVSSSLSSTINNNNNNTVGNDSNCTNSDEDSSNNDPQDRKPQSNTLNKTVKVATCPIVREYLRMELITGKVQLGSNMNDALYSYVDDVLGSDHIEKSYEGLQQALESVQQPPTQNTRDAKAKTEGKPRCTKAMRKAERYAYCQRLFQENKSKLAAELFDGVDNSAVRPPIAEAHEHFSRIWAVETNDAGQQMYNTATGEDVLLAPITREEIITAIDNTRADTAVGPDRLPLGDIKRIAKNELWCAYNIWLGSRRIPDSLKVNRTVLLPKGKDDLDKIKNWRPITISSLLIRIYNKILAKRMSSVFHTSSKQTGFKPVNGVGQNVALLHNILRHARSNKNNISICLLDVSKAFDSVSHESISRALKRNGCPLDFIELIENQYENAYTTISYSKNEISAPIRLKRGVKQGDPMSSILFNLVIDELFEIIGDRFGYVVEGVGSVNARAFADDIALISGSEIGMQQLLSATEQFLKARGLDLNADKCISICLRKAGKVKKSQIADNTVKNPPSFTVNQRPIQLLGIDQQCRYLGVQFTPLGAVNLKVTVPAVKAALECLSKAPLKPQQKIVLLRTHLIPRFVFAFTHTECYPKLINQQDRTIRRWLKKTLRLPESACTEFFYLPTKEGGLGIGKLYDIIGIAKIKLHGSFCRANDECLRFLAETQSSTMHARWCNAMKLNYRPAAVDIQNRNILQIDESRKRLDSTVHGLGSSVFRTSPITNQWLQGQTRLMKGYTYIRAIHMRTNTTATRVSTTRGRNVSKKCRRCGLADETLNHILQTCPITQGMRCTRHNNVCRKVADKLRSKGFQVFSEQGIPSPGLQTNISRPDLIATRGEMAYVLDITCVFESSQHNLQDAYRRKVERYKPLEEAIKQKYKVHNVIFHGLCVGSRGAYDPRHLSIWHSIGFTSIELGVLAVGVIEDSLRTITLFNNANRLGI